jgi:cold shock CspA family protein
VDPVSPSTVQKGVVKTFIKERGFGFIRYKGGAKDVFFHVRHLDEASFGDDPSSTTIDVDETVSFVVRDDPKNGKKMATQI